jgi:hypothetical protein
MEDTRRMQAAVMGKAKKADEFPPKYALIRLIDKGSSGRTYKS